MRKGQSEAFGLAIIVLLLVISAVVFLLRPHNNGVTDNQKEAQKILNDNFAYALIQSNVKYTQGGGICRGNTLLYWIPEYYNNPDAEVYCRSGEKIGIGNAITQYINATLNETLVKWHQPFNLTIGYPGSSRNFSFGYPDSGGCNGKELQGKTSYDLSSIKILFYTC